MKLQPITSDDPRAVLRALRGAVLGSGPAAAFGGADLPDDVPPGTAIVVTTSGSSGVPKSVAISRSALTSSALATAARIGSGAWLLALPATYIAGIQVLVRSLVADREPAVLSGTFSPAAFTAAARGLRSMEGGSLVPTYTSLVPAQLDRLLDDEAAQDALRSFEAVLIGGQALAVPLRERAAEAGVRVVRTYGSSETSGGCVYDGIPLEGVAARVVEGELQLAGPMLADGYVGEPDRTASVFVRDTAGTRWYRTGDAGDIHDGVLQVSGRLDNVIVSGGVNISLDRVEQAVQTVAGLERAVVVGVADEQWGEASVIVVAGAVPADAFEVARAAVADAVGPYARPARIVEVAELPLLTSGKPDRASLRRAIAG